MAVNQPPKLFVLPAEVLQLISKHLPYQTALRFLATCRFLQYLLSKEQLKALRLKDPSEVWKTEQALFQKLRVEPEWPRDSRVNSWELLRLGKLELPCYTCLCWLDCQFWFPAYYLYGLGLGSVPARTCLRCLVEGHVHPYRQKGIDISKHWRTCFECGQLAWAGSSKTMPAGVVSLHDKQYCKSCAGSHGENVPELQAKRNPWVWRQRARVAAARRAEEVREARRIERAGVSAQDLDLLVVSLAELDISKLFAMKQ